MVFSADELKKAPNTTGVILDFPLETEFYWLQQFLPDHKTIGVLFSTAENRRKIEEAGHIAQRMGLTLVAREVETPQGLPEALNSLSNRVDVLWAVADHLILSPQLAKSLLLYSFRSRIPFVGVSEPWVKAGALYALDRDYTDVGIQCGEMAVKVIREQKRINELPPVAPRKVMYSLNLHTARQMSLTIPPALIQGAHQVFQ